MIQVNTAKRRIVNLLGSTDRERASIDWDMDSADFKSDPKASEVFRVYY